MLSKYGDVAAPAMCELLALAVETGGRWSNEAVDFLKYRFKQLGKYLSVKLCSLFSFRFRAFSYIVVQIYITFYWAAGRPVDFFAQIKP